MKVKELHEILNSMEYRIHNINESEDIKILKSLYENLSLNSGYFFSNILPNDIDKSLNEMIADIYMIKEDMRNKIKEKSEDLEL